MTCFHPNKGFVVGLKPNGKLDIKFCSHEVQYIWSDDPTFKKYHRSKEPLSPYVSECLELFDDYVLFDAANGIDSVFYCVNSIYLPCGQCIGCRIDKSREWADRMIMESSYYPNNCFITLTYDDEHVPKASYFDSDGVSKREAMTLRKKDFQDFMKRLRESVCVYDDNGKVTEETKIRFYACGEYGTTTYRPHYHAIIFNWFPPVGDLHFHHHDSRGYNFYTSDTLSKVWKDGFHLVSFVTWESCAYTSRYVTKKICKDDKDYYDHFNIEPEFSLMSRKPGLAYRWYEDHKDDIYKLDSSYIIRLSNGKNVIETKPPRYFDSLFDIENPDVLAEIKEIRRFQAQNIADLKLSKTDKNYFGMLADEELRFKGKTKWLKRVAI